MLVYYKQMMHDLLIDSSANARDFIIAMFFLEILYQVHPNDVISIYIVLMMLYSTSAEDSCMLNKVYLKILDPPSLII